ncbi:MAG: pitrilysin family protein [Candidatus Aminicenantes bacterium]|nr:pitrilysin family protein [Candidatus Aminicenantes bacterium]
MSRRLFAPAFACALLGLLLGLTGCRRDDPQSLRLELLPFDGSPLVAVRVLVKVGSAVDPAGKEGLCRLTWRLLLEGGSRSRGPEEIAAALAPVGAGIRLDIDKEMSAFSATVRREDWAAFYSVLSELLLEPGFRENDFERLKASQLDALRESLAGGEDETLAGEILDRMIYAGQPYGHAEDGTLESVASLTIDEAKAFYLEHFVRGNIAIGLAGGYPTGSPESVKSDFLRLPVTFTPRLVLPPPHRPRGIEAVLAERPADGATIAMGIPVSLTAADEDFFALWVAAAHLGEPGFPASRLGRLGTASVGSSGLDCEATSASALPRRGCCFAIRLHPADQSAALFLVRQAARELRLLAEEGLPEERFDLVRDYLLHSLSLRSRTLGDRLARRMEAGILVRADVLEEARRILPRLSAGDIRAAVRKYVDPEAFFLAIVAKDASALRDGLLSGAAASLPEAARSAGGGAAEEIAAIQAYPLGIRPEAVRVVAAESLIHTAWPPGE